MSRTIRIASAALVMCLLCTAGCAGTKDTPPATVGKFASTVNEADAAWAIGDAGKAFDLYTEALKMPDAVDADGSIAERQNLAKHTYIARTLLGKPSGGYDITPLTAIIIDHSVAETETLEAQKQLVAFMRREGQGIRKDIPELRRTIEAEESYKVPTSAYMVASLDDMWTKEFSTIPGDYGTQANAALKLLIRAGYEVSACADEKWVEDAVAHLDKALQTLDELDKKLDSIEG